MWWMGSTIFATDLFRNEQVAEKRPSATFPSSFVVAAYNQVRLTLQDFGGLASGPFGATWKDDFFSSLLDCQRTDAFSLIYPSTIRNPGSEIKLKDDCFLDGLDDFLRVINDLEDFQI